MNHVRIVGITSVSGGGKTVASMHLAKALGEAVAIHFDDYDGTNVHPANLQRWFTEGADYDVYETPLFTRHLRTLKAGQSIDYPISGAIVGPARYVVADAPLGRAHSDSGKLIDMLVFIDTPLDIAMARRILRDIEPADEFLQDLKSELAEYESYAKPIYEHFQERMQADCDLIIDGTLGIDLIVERIHSELGSALATT